MDVRLGLCPTLDDGPGNQGRHVWKHVGTITDTTREGVYVQVDECAHCGRMVGTETRHP